MTLHELWEICPRCFLFIKQEDGRVREYKGSNADAFAQVADIYATKYPMYDNVLEVKLKEETE